MFRKNWVQISHINEAEYIIRISSVYRTIDQSKHFQFSLVARSKSNNIGLLYLIRSFTKELNIVKLIVMYFVRKQKVQSKKIKRLCVARSRLLLTLSRHWTHRSNPVFMIGHIKIPNQCAQVGFFWLIRFQHKGVLEIHSTAASVGDEKLGYTKH